MPTRRAVLSLSAAALAGCASPNPSLYTLQAVPGPTVPGGPRVVELRDLSLARYLQRPQIVRSSEDYRLDVLSNDWWGEPLEAMLTRVIVQNLTQRLPGSTVFSESSAVSADADASVEVNIQRMDADAAGAVVLAAQVSVRAGRRPYATRTLRLTVPPTAPGVTGFVAAASTALGQLADAMATMLAA